MRTTTTDFNPVNWFEVPVTDLPRAKKFYENTFGTELTLSEMGDAKMAFFKGDHAQAGAMGALVLCDGYTPCKDGSIVYFSVTDIEATLTQAADAGATVSQPKTSIGEHGFIAQFTDSEGNRIALHSSK